MSGAVAENRFAAPRAEVEDHVDPEARMVDAGRGQRLLAVLIDGLLPAILVIVIAVSVAIPAYENYRQRRMPGIEPPQLGSSHHLTTEWVLLASLALVAFFIYSAVLVYLYGQTFGKRMMDIRVVRVDGSRVSFPRFIFIRWLPLAVIGCIPVVGGLVALLDPLLIFRDSSRCLHDDIANTRVVTASSSVEATLHGDPKNASANLRTISF